MKLPKHLNPSTAIASIALFAALGGVAYAAVPKNSVGTPQLRNFAVNTAKLKNGAVTTPKLRNGAVAASKLRNGAVLSEKLADGAVDSSKLGQGSVRSAALGGGVVTNPKIQNGAVNEAKLANGAVGTAKLGGNAVSAEKLAANAVSTGKVQDGAISAAKLNAGLLSQLVKDVSYVNQSTAVGDASPQTATASCPAGKQVIGGGFRIVYGDATSVEIIDSYASVEGEKHTGWTVAAATAEAGKSFAIQAQAICASF